MRDELVTMVVVIKLDAVLRQNLARVVEHSGCFPRQLLCERPVVRNPRRARVFKPERLRLFGHSFGILLETVVAEVPCHRLEMFFRQQL